VSAARVFNRTNRPGNLLGMLCLGDDNSPVAFPRRSSTHTNTCRIYIYLYTTRCDSARRTSWAVVVLFVIIIVCVYVRTKISFRHNDNNRSDLCVYTRVYICAYEYTRFRKKKRREENSRPNTHRATKSGTESNSRRRRALALRCTRAHVSKTVRL